MTLLCNNSFNEIIEKYTNIAVNELLPLANNKIYNSFNSNKSIQKSTNGMNVSIICINELKSEITYAGAKNSILIANKAEVQELKVDLYSIRYLPNYDFKLHEFRVNPGDEIYLTTDGIVNQIGGPQNRKFLKSNLISTIRSIYGKPASEQRKLILSVFNNWKGNNEQRDDVCLICVKINP